MTKDFGFVEIERARRIAKRSAGGDGADGHPWIS
jgi:hypothetical protein